MPDIIQLLPDNLANQIAAGEVIQRPASMVKELVENAIDAQATKITIILKDAGKTLTRIIDNGVGMTETDARLSFERHATSKIRTSADLFQIKTKGFRGEALASIAAVAEVEMKTNQDENDIGTHIVIHGSELIVQEPIACPKGTDIVIRRLFYNVPARRKFLKNDTSELRYILQEFHRTCIPHPQIHFELFHNDKLVSSYFPESKKKRIVQVWGNKFEDKLVALVEETEHLNIEGFITTAQGAKKSRGNQYFFINNRYFKSAYLHHAVKAAYGNLIPEGSHPSYALFLTVDPGMVDMNVHPSKQEIKFQDERMVYNLLKAAVRQAIAQHHLIPMVNFDKPSEVISSAFGQNQQKPSSGTSSYERPSTGWKPQEKTEHWKAIYEDLKSSASSDPSVEQKDLFTQPHSEENPVDFNQPLSHLWNSYITYEGKDGLVLIDQFAAHYRVLYELFLERINNDQPMTQLLLFPETLEMGAEETTLIERILPELQAIGFDIEPFGGQTFLLRGIPAINDLGQLNDDSLSLLIQDMIEEKDSKEPFQHRVAKQLAFKAAIRKGQTLDHMEMTFLVSSLFACKEPDYSPNGNRCFIELNQSEIQNRFSNY